MIAVLGPGGVGGFVAAALARAGEQIVVVAREPTAELIARHGVNVRSVRLGEFSARPEAVSHLQGPVDCLIVATKAAGLAAGIERIEAEPGLVVPLLNGVDHMQLLRERFPESVAAGSIRIESHRAAAGEIVQTSPFLRVEIAAQDPALGQRVARLAATLNQAEIPARIERSEAQVLWSKLVRLGALSCTTSAADRPIGFIRSDPQWRRALEDSIVEAAKVARAEGAQIDPADTLAELDQAHADLGSSMRRDISAGREPELDAIAGSILRAAARHGVECPTIARLADQIAQRAGIPAPVA